ncbi:SNARE Tlg2 [Schizosaccharomyces japonicus yFS275]|uniref:SNARE Tlg2 n=1 Tax=Schizosaccharomyces japonicus (strain yFS275 / FY16936) TaxID=402676 RepID=B6K899_SCHJY|nr:SNARE Tlg2 [Schizosaccharomyces japonicus yFS275]EEB09753.1 SNARE Tlg2 [Schizosaccharomyces japonicus yFS275]
MAYRDRTALYITFRQSYVHHGSALSQHFWDPDDERSKLVQQGENNNVAIEMDILPPSWLDIEASVDGLLENAKQNIAVLDKYHSKHLLPSFSDKSEMEQRIQQLNIEITSDFQRCQKLLQQVRKQSAQAKGPEARVAANFITSIAGRIQQASTSFRKKQSLYLKRIRGLNDFTTDISPMDDAVSDVAISKSTIQQAALMEEQGEDQNAIENERAIAKIAEGILELAQMFQELQTLVIDQGALIDRIDYNIERTQNYAHSAEKELKKAEQTQHNTGRLRFICFLILMIIALIFVLVFKLLSV